MGSETFSAIPNMESILMQKNNQLEAENRQLQDELFRLRKESESIKASHYYKASSLESKL